MRIKIVSASFIIFCLMTHSPAYSNTTVNYSKALQQQLASKLAEKGSSYKARTRHLKNGQPIYTNRLILTDSPYLLQHAHNPVNWFPWGDEAFATAKRENKPIFLSIGYATCHWCHVMEEESFENLEVADLLNQHFIAIKVDREQHPDIDSTYMTAVTLLTGRGGWPMSSFITSEGKPFFGGTYFPQPTFVDLLNQVNTAWQQKHETLLVQASRLAEAVSKETSKQGAITSLQQSAVQAAIQQILSGFDASNGGFSPAPKFPNEPLLLLLLQAAERSHHPQIMSALNKTLSAMAEGGIYDQIGGGFHRYSTDEQWLVPHFEKMLYNQAYLVRVYAQAYRLTQNPVYARIVRQTLDYVLREMRNSHGVFYSATDADSEGEEGTYFVWTPEQITALLKADDAAFISQVYGLKAKGNFEGKNIFYLSQSLQDTAKQDGISVDSLFARLDSLLQILRQSRLNRIPPLTDNKVIVAWNGMLITALAEAGSILNDPRYIEAAKTASAALWSSQRTKDGELWRINLDNKVSIAAKQSDYAHYTEALLALYDVSNNPADLEKAQQIADEMVEQFMDPSTGTLTMGKDPLLFTQPKDAHDGALPSGNAVAVRVFNRLFKRTGLDRYNQQASQILQTFSSNIIRQPSAYSYMLAQLDEMNEGEIQSYQYTARSAIKIEAKIDQREADKYHLTLHFTIKPGWHINSHKPLQKDLIATSINVESNSSWQLTNIQYPKAELIKTNFNKNTLALYQGNFAISAELTAFANVANKPININLKTQACNQDSCLAPESLTLFLTRL